MGAPVVHFEIMGGNGNELEKFYAELFGWKINSNNPLNYGSRYRRRAGGYQRRGWRYP